MTRADNTHHLRRAATARHDNALERATTALADLNRTGKAVTFTTVAKTGNVSRTWLYTQPALRDTITSLRNQPTQPKPGAVPAAQRATDDSLRQRLDTARQDLTRLRAENQILRDQLALALGEQRTP